jgi:hypothetical protein
MPARTKRSSKRKESGIIVISWRKQAVSSLKWWVKNDCIYGR